MFNWEDVLKIVLALVAGGLIGLEREYRDKAAGFRTLILICIGSTLFTILSGQLADPPNARIAAGIVTGVGFLGTGVILRDEKAGRVMGLTTAALIWMSAAVGMCLGAGFYALSAVAVAVTMLVLWLLPKVEAFIDHTQDSRTYEVVMRTEPGRFEALDALVSQGTRKTRLTRRVQRRDSTTLTWHVIAEEAVHKRIRQALLDDRELEEVRL